MLKFINLQGKQYNSPFQFAPLSGLASNELASRKCGPDSRHTARRESPPAPAVAPPLWPAANENLPKLSRTNRRRTRTRRTRSRIRTRISRAAASEILATSAAGQERATATVGNNYCGQCRWSAPATPTRPALQVGTSGRHFGSSENKNNNSKSAIENNNTKKKRKKKKEKRKKKRRRKRKEFFASEQAH